MVAGGEVGDPVLELVGVEVVDVGEGGGFGCGAELRLHGDPFAQAVAMPALLPTPEKITTRLSELVEGADHDHVPDRTRSNRSSTQPVEKVVEGRV